MIEAKRIKRRVVKIKKLNPSIRVGGNLWDAILGLRFSLKYPELLSEEAIYSLALVHPIHVVEEGSEFAVVGNNLIAVLVQRLPPQTQLPVMVWPRKEHIPVHVSAFLSCLAFGLGSQRNHGILNLFLAQSEDERLWISSTLRNRSGLEKLAGVSRKLKPENPQIIRSKANQLALDWTELSDD